MITVEEALDRLDINNKYLLVDRLQAMTRICIAIREEGYILLNTKSFDSNSSDDCLTAVQNAIRRKNH